MADDDERQLRELWSRECRRVSREVQPVEPLLQRLRQCTFDWSDDDFQSLLVTRVLHDAQQVSFPPNKFRSAHFWRELLACMRERLPAGAALHPELLAKEAEAMSIGDAIEAENMTAGWYRSFELASIADETTTSTLEGPTNSIVVLPTCTADRTRCFPFRVESGNMAASIGLVMWPAGFLLCEFALDHPELFRGKRILELGAGIGLTSVVCARYTRPKAIIATDFDTRALQNIHHNFKLNGLAQPDSVFSPPIEEEVTATSPDETFTSSDSVELQEITVAEDGDAASSCEVHTARVDWYHYSPDQIRAFDADVVIACDTTYVEAILVPFAQTVRACIDARPGVVVYLAQAERHPSTFMLYLDALRDEGLKLEELPTSGLHQRFNYDRVTCPIALHRVTRA